MSDENTIMEKKRLNPWFIFGLSIWVLWAAWVLWGLIVPPKPLYGGHWPELEAEDPSILLIIIIALLPGAGLLLLPRQIEDDGKRWWQPSVAKEMVDSWTKNIVQVMIAVIVVGGSGTIVGSVVSFYKDPSEYIGWEWLYDQLARCDRLEGELMIDRRCIDSVDCTMSRDDLESHQERRAKYNRYCINRPDFEHGFR